MPGRPKDKFGLGAFVLSPNDDLITGLSPLLTLGNESGSEAFYTFAVTDQLRITANAQVIDPFIREADTIVTLGLRVRVTF